VIGKLEQNTLEGKRKKTKEEGKAICYETISSYLNLQITEVSRSTKENAEWLIVEVLK
jgi:hypothetical protein